MSDLPQSEFEARLAAIRARTPARIFVGRAGAAYRTETLLGLREDHAAAIDAVQAELNLGPDFLDRWNIFEVASQARSKAEYLARPDLGRILGEAAKAEIRRNRPSEIDVQVIIGDGLSAVAVETQVPALLPDLKEQARMRGWRFGRPFVVRYCRVGILNDVGELLNPTVAVLLIGERPGLATAESLSAYLAYRPRTGNTDADRNLVSNIHARGVSADAAAKRIADIADRMMRQGLSGTALKEDGLVPSLDEPQL